MKVNKEQLVAALKTRKEALEEKLVEYILGAPTDVPAESLMPKVRYNLGRINELEETITFIEETLE